MAWITEVRLTGKGKKDAIVCFERGPNVISGDSDTGKSYILKCIDYVLGADEMVKVIDEALGYEVVWLELMNENNEVLSLERHLTGGDVVAYADKIEAVLALKEPRKEGDGVEILKPKRVGKSKARDVTSRILPFWGMPDDIKLRRNDKGETQRLTVRTLFPIFLKDEFSMIEEDSSIFGNGFGQTPKKRMLSYLLTGVDDSSIISQEQQGAAQTGVKAQLSLIERLLDPIEKRLSERASVAEDSESVNRVNNIIENLSLVLSEHEEEIDRLQKKKREQIEVQQYAESQLIAIDELLVRYRLLKERYLSDLGVCRI